MSGPFILNRTKTLMHKRGFTFIELIVSMVLVSILGVFLSGILSRAVQSYTAASSRATIGASLATAFDTLNFDLQNVLPNSTRVTTAVVGGTVLGVYGAASVTASAVEFFNVAYGPFPYRNYDTSSTGSVYDPTCTGSCLTACTSANTTCTSNCTATYNSCMTTATNTYNTCTSGCGGSPGCMGTCSTQQTNNDNTCSTSQTSCNSTCTSNYNTCAAKGNYHVVGYTYAAYPSYFMNAGTINSSDVDASGVSAIVLGNLKGVGDGSSGGSATGLYTNGSATLQTVYGGYFGRWPGETYADYAGETYSYIGGAAFPSNSANNFGFFIYSANNPVSYVCVPSTSSTGAGIGTLTKYWGYTRSSTQTASPSSAYSSIVVGGVSACSFSVTSPAGLTTLASPTFLTVYLQITDSNGEVGTLVQEIPLNNKY